MQACRIAIQGLAGLFVLGTFLVARAVEVPTLKDDDPLPVNASWKGKFSQAGTHPELTFPPELEATLTVVRRDGDNVDLELRETLPGMDITFLCRGRVTRNADGSLSLEFQSHGVKGQPNAGFYLIDVPYSAKIVDDTIKGSWKYVVRDDGIDLGGEYALIRE